MTMIMIFFLLGAIIGSFLTAVLHRFEQGSLGSILTGRSHCPDCRTQLTARELIPIVSYLVQRGHCRRCRKPLGWHYLGLELTAGTFFSLGYVRYGLSLDLVFYLLILALLLLIALYDLRHQLIPNILIWVSGPLGFIFGLKTLGLTFGQIILGWLTGVLIILLIYVGTRGRGMGEGDVWLAGLIGLTLGLPLSLVALWLAFVVGAGVSLVIIASQKFFHFRPRYQLKSRIAFGPFLIIGLIVTMLWGTQVLNWYLKLLDLPIRLA